MSDPFCERCQYCNSPNVLDDAWFCDAAECWRTYEAESAAQGAYESRLPLTTTKARIDLSRSEANVWGHFVRRIHEATDRLMAVGGFPIGDWHDRERRRRRQEFARVSDIPLTTAPPR